MDIGMQHGQGHAAWRWTCNKNIDMDTDMDIYMGMIKTWTQTIIELA
jgi:hypothetical protein